MLTVSQAARLVGRDSSTVRRWIRAGELRARKVGGEHRIEERDLEAMLEGSGAQLLPASWSRLADGRPMPNLVGFIRARRGPI